MNEIEKAIDELVEQELGSGTEDYGPEEDFVFLGTHRLHPGEDPLVGRELFWEPVTKDIIWSREGEWRMLSGADSPQKAISLLLGHYGQDQFVPNEELTPEDSI